MKMLISLNLILIFFTNLIYCLPNGAPKSACNTLQPKHGTAKTQTSASPYTIKFDKKNFKINEPVMLTIHSSSNKSFKGFMIVARASSTSNQNIGSFVSTGDVNLFKCTNNNDAVTHKNALSKSSTKVKWTPPSGYKGTVVFRYTVVAEVKKFWSNKISDTVTFA